jgi:hypothetical protein
MRLLVVIKQVVNIHGSVSIKQILYRTEFLTFSLFSLVTKVKREREKEKEIE